MHWYERAQPTVQFLLEDVKSSIETISSIEGVDSVKVWGSFAENIKKATASVKEVDLVISCNFNSGDLLAIDKGSNGPFDIPFSDLEDEGFNPLAVSLTKKLIKSCSTFNPEFWVVSRDQKLLHWGPVYDTIEEWKEVRKSADSKAEEITGIDRSSLHKSSKSDISNWFGIYEETIKEAAIAGPMGWYASSSECQEMINDSIDLFE